MNGMIESNWNMTDDGGFVGSHLSPLIHACSRWRPGPGHGHALAEVDGFGDVALVAEGGGRR
jgi:hypothetical protein